MTNEITRSDAEILSDIEFNGIERVLIELEMGMRVPACFAEHIKNLLEREYSMKLRIHTYANPIHSGHFCLMRYNDKNVMLRS